MISSAFFGLQIARPFHLVPWGSIEVTVWFQVRVLAGPPILNALRSATGWNSPAGETLGVYFGRVEAPKNNNSPYSLLP